MMINLKVLHVIGSVGIGGAEKHVLDLCIQQKALGIDVHVALPALGALSSALVKSKIPFSLVRAGGRWNPRALWSLRGAIGIIQPSVIHAHMLKSATMVGRINRTIPCVATAHNIVKHADPFQHCQHVICVSEMVQDSLCHLAYPVQKTSIIHNAVDTHTFSTKKRDEVRQRMGWHDQLIITCIARLVPAKGQIYAINALPELIAAYPNVKLLLVGAGGDEEKLTQLADDLGVTQFVIKLGARNDIPELLAATDIYLQPSIKEGFCIAFLEAMATGLPCIGTTTGAIPSMVANGKNGLLIPPMEVSSIVDAVLKLAGDPALRVSYSNAAKITANVEFSPKKQVADTLQVYQRVVGLS